MNREACNQSSSHLKRRMSAVYSRRRSMILVLYLNIFCLPKCISSASVHKVIAEMRNTPAEPRPSLRSQLRKAGEDHRGHIMLSTDSELCPNSYVNVNPNAEINETAEIVQSIFAGPPPNDSISIITAVGQIAVHGYVQGVPIILSNRDDRKALYGVISAVSIHPATGKILRHYRHPPYTSEKLLKAFVESLQPGRILLISGSSRFMTESMGKYLISLGANLPGPFFPSKIPHSLPPVVMITWLGIIGGKTLASASRLWHPQLKEGLYQEFSVPIKEDDDWCNGTFLQSDWSSGPAWEARQKLCKMHDGYGAFCSCPPLPPPMVKNISNPKMSDTVVVVMASRPPSLHRLLSSVIGTGSILRENIMVFTNQEKDPELSLVCQSHGVFLEWTGRASDCEALHRTRLYESALRASHILRPKGQLFLTLEDDMEVKPDIFRWLSKARRIVQKNDNLICINTIDVRSNKTKTKENKENLATDAEENKDHFGMITGEKFMPGWAVERDILEAMLKFWPLAIRDLQWDQLMDYWAGDYPCVPPPKSYIKHMAASFFSLGADLSTAYPDEVEDTQFMNRPYVMTGK